MSRQDERERALVRVGVDVGSDCRHRPLSDEECDVLRYAAGPRPATDAAAVRAEIVAELRARATSEQVCADRNRPEYGERSMMVAPYEHSANTLRELADRIEAAHPQAEPARYTRKEVLAFGKAVRWKCDEHDDPEEEVTDEDLAVLLDATVKR